VSVASNGAQANSASLSPRISGSGRFVLFTSYADNLVPGDTNGTFDAFVHDRATGVTERASVSSRRTQANGPSEFHHAIARDGGFVAFSSKADNLVPADTNRISDVFVHWLPAAAGRAGR
jgi:hypothetical protein